MRRYNEKKKNFIHFRKELQKYLDQRQQRKLNYLILPYPEDAQVLLFLR